MAFISPAAIRTAATVCLAAALSACSTYKPAPVDFARDTAEWRQCSLALCPPGSALSLAALHRIGLFANPDLNKARLTCARSKDAAAYAGLWQDPSLSTELERVLKENITNHSFSAGFSLPVTGLPKLSHRIAEHYAEADYWELRAQERSYLAGLDTLRYRIMAAHAKRSLMQGRLAFLRDEQERMTRLYEMGEVELSDYQSSSQRLHDTEKGLQELDKEHLTLHQELIGQLGLHPAVGEVELAGSLPAGVPALVPTPAPEQMLQAPAIKAALATYGASEDELKAEIRRQYPEISLSPGYGKEDEEEKLTLGLELNLPLWNRNREAIARARGSRALQQHDTLQRWRVMLQECSALQGQQHLLHQHCQSEHGRLADLLATADKQEKLYSIGESSLPALAEARHEVYQRQLSYLDCLATLLDVQTRLQYLNPYYNPS